MCASAMASRWAVETPGLSSASILSRTSATMRPARRMRSISARDLRVTMSRLRPVGQRREQRLGHRVDRLAAVDRGQDAVVTVVLDDLEQRRHLLGHPRPDGDLGVVGTLDELGAVEVAQALDL